MKTRFAPSPTGPLHLGHAFSALTVWDIADAHQGTALLRIEDTDAERSKPHWEQQIFDDLRWLGLVWTEPVRRQSDHTATYGALLDDLGTRGLAYPCSCRRADIRAAWSAPQEGAKPPVGPDGPVYPGTCRGRPMDSRRPGDAIRLDIAAALATISEERLAFRDDGPVHPGRHDLDAAHLIAGVGDVVLGRRETGAAAYHLAVVADDAAQEITHVVRGADLFDATAIHVVLQAILRLPTPRYHHHRLIRDEAGKRLAKRDDARAISAYRAAGETPSSLRAMVGLPPTRPAPRPGS